MKITAAALPCLLLVLGAATARTQAPHVLSCEIPAPITATAASDAKPAPRIFRLSKGRFEAWNPQEQAFSENLCEVFTCTARADRLEGSLSSASVVYTVGVDAGTGRAYWRVLGASNLPRAEGSCEAVADPTRPKP